MIGNISNLSTHFRMLRLGAAMKNGIESVGKELSTGIKSNLEDRNGAIRKQLDSMERSLALSDLRLQNLIVADNYVSSVTAVVKGFKVIAEEFGPRLLAAAAIEDQTSTEVLAGEAVSLFQGAISSLNVRQGGRTLLAGVSADQPATISANEILDALEVLTSNAGSAAEVSLIVDDYFTNPVSGYALDAYRGATMDVAEVELGKGESVKVQLRADDENFRNVLSELAQVVLVARGSVQLQSDQLFQLLETVGKGLISSKKGMLSLTAGLGQSEERIALAQARTAAEKASTEISRNAIISANPYDAASQFHAIQAQLQSHYTVVAKLSQLSLTAYLR